MYTYLMLIVNCMLQNEPRRPCSPPPPCSNNVRSAPRGCCSRGHHWHAPHGHVRPHGHGPPHDVCECDQKSSRVQIVIVRAHFQMTFHFGYCEDVLFDAWKVRSVGALIGSMIGIMILAALYEGLKYYRCASLSFYFEFFLICRNLFCFREYLFWKSNNSIQYRSVTPPEKAGQAEDAKVVQ